MFADFLSNRVWSLRVEHGQAVDVILRTGQIVTGGAPLIQIASFGVDETARSMPSACPERIYRLTPFAAAGDASYTISSATDHDTIWAIGNDAMERRRRQRHTDQGDVLGAISLTGGAGADASATPQPPVQTATPSPTYRDKGDAVIITTTANIPLSAYILSGITLTLHGWLADPLTVRL